MKQIWFLCFCVAAVFGAFVPVEERANGENGWFVPKVDGSFSWIDKTEAESNFGLMRQMDSRSMSNSVQFYLYTKRNPLVGQKIYAAKESIHASKFNASNPTRITIHGWTANYQDVFSRTVRDAYLSLGNYNIIAIDWADARTIDYVSAVFAIPSVGQTVADLLDHLVKQHALNLDNVQIIGFSLGAHVAGFCGKRMTSGKVNTIYGLDPAQPLFSYNQPTMRLASTDAKYVESIHTNSGSLGFLKPIGTNAFYPNGGITQPGCGFDLMGLCAHFRSSYYFAKALRQDKFVSIKCKSYMDAIAKNCGSTYSSVRMGSSINAKMGSGIYYVPINGDLF